MLPLVLALTAPGLPAQSTSLLELERSCSRAADDNTPDNLAALNASIEKEAGARLAFLRGCRFMAEKKFGPAGGEFEKAVRAEPNEAVYHFWFGRATGEQASRANPIRQPGLARRTKGEFERAIALDSSYVAAREGLLRYYLAAPGFLGGSIDQARVQAGHIARLAPYRGGLAHANVALAAKDTAGVIQAHEGLVAQFPDSLTPYLALVNVQLARKQFALAWAAVERLERVKPDLPFLPYVIGRAAAESGEQLDRGEAALRRYLQHTPKPNEPSPASTHWRLGMIAEKRGDTAAAKQQYQAAAALDPKLRPVKEALARLK
ncbi:MAG TPA: hypothetical protein VFZ73_17040 [Gemmatimonadaceae bacterium]